MIKLQNTKSNWMMMMCYNLRRLMSILDINSLKRWFNMLYLFLLNAFQPNRADVSHFFNNTSFYKMESRNYLMPLKAFY